jgi:hypothetical protein
VTKIWDRGVARGQLVLIADLGDHPYRPLAPLPAGSTSANHLT